MPRTRTPKRPAAYERISKYDATHATAQVPGIGRQAKANDAQARALGWPAPVHYADNESAYNPNKTRPDFDRLCEDLKSGAVDAVIVWDVDRLLRQVRTVVELIDIVEATGARFVSVSSGEYELDTANGRFAATILAAVAQKESDDKSRRLKAKHAQLAADGRARYEAATDDEAVAGFQLLCSTEGILPALESAHAVGWLAREAGRAVPSGSTVLVTLSGRGDKDVAQIAARLGEELP